MPITNESVERYKKAKKGNEYIPKTPEGQKEYIKYKNYVRNRMGKPSEGGGVTQNVQTQYKCGGSHKYYNGGAFTGTTPLRYKRGGGARGKCYPYG